MSFLKNFFGSGQGTSLAKSKNILDLVTSTASLASNPTQIDPVLDSVRTISSRLTPGAPLSASDEETLFGVYLRLEKYLTNDEPIRTFTKDELRARLSPELLDRLAVYESKNKGGV